jgi:threonine synthase
MIKQKKWVTKCLLCKKSINPVTHKCTDGSWTKYYGLFEEIINKDVLTNSLKSNIDIVSKKFINKQEVSIWDFQEFLPIVKNISLGEGGTPLLQLKNYHHDVPFKIFIKNEGTNPSKVFKDRESSIAINRCIRDGYNKVTLASTGNAAQSISLYAKQVGISPFLFISDKTSKSKITKMVANNASIIILENSHMEDAFKVNRDLSPFLDSIGIKDCNPGIDWIRGEGDKTIAFELLAQLNTVPDWIILACGNGSSTHGIFKGFKELKEAGITNKLPKMVGVQIEGGDPIPRGVRKLQDDKPIEIQNPPSSFGDSAVASFDYIAAVQSIIESKGLGISVEDKNIAKCLASFIKLEQELLTTCIPEVTTAETLAALEIMIQKKIIHKEENVVLFFSSHATNGRDHLKELLKCYDFRNEWNMIKNLIPEPLDNLNDRFINKANDKVRIVPKNLTLVKNAVMELLEATK